MDLSKHPTKAALEGLIPEARVEGGTFNELLPDPHDVSIENGKSIIKDLRHEATKMTLNNLLDSFNIDIEPPLERRPKGNRVWPAGYVGSLTHKGTIVLGALVQRREFRSIGVDLELDQNGARDLSHVVTDGEIPPSPNTEVGFLAAFSVKESVYKAVYPIMGRDIGYDDVLISWNRRSEFGNEGVANCPESIEVKIKCAYAGDWVVSAAQY
jgi:4'-phosphopantetheinyl transferase EntD